MSIKERREREEQSRLATILVAAEAVFIEKGYHSARMDDIAEAAELAKGTLYYYFKSKDEIYLHLLKREARKAHEEIRRMISESSSFLEILEKAFNFYVEYFDRNPGFLKMFLPCMCGFVRFEDAGAVRDWARTYGDHGGYIRAALRTSIRKEGLPFKLEELEKFVQTMQIGISFMLLENRMPDARAAVKFFLDLIRHVMEESS